MYAYALWRLIFDNMTDPAKSRNTPITDDILYRPVLDMICPLTIVATERLSIIGARSTHEFDAETENTP